MPRSWRKNLKFMAKLSQLGPIFIFSIICVRTNETIFNKTESTRYTGAHSAHQWLRNSSKQKTKNAYIWLNRKATTKARTILWGNQKAKKIKKASPRAPRPIRGFFAPSIQDECRSRWAPPATFRGSRFVECVACFKSGFWVIKNVIFVWFCYRVLPFHFVTVFMRFMNVFLGESYPKISFSLFFEKQATLQGDRGFGAVQFLLRFFQKQSPLLREKKQTWTVVSISHVPVLLGWANGFKWSWSRYMFDVYVALCLKFKVQGKQIVLYKM